MVEVFLSESCLHGADRRLPDREEARMTSTITVLAITLLLAMLVSTGWLGSPPNAPGGESAPAPRPGHLRGA